MKIRKDLFSIELVEEETQNFLDWVTKCFNSVDEPFIRAKILATRLGAHYHANGLTDIAFWVPEVMSNLGDSQDCSQITHHYQIKKAQIVYLTVFTPLQPIDFRADEQVIPFQCEHLPLKNHQNFFCGVFAGMRAGTKEQAGTFYCLQYLDSKNQIHTIGDVLAYSLPYGVFAPAELYNIELLQQQRKDLNYFRPVLNSDYDFVDSKISTPRNILQLHVGTASAEGTLEGLTRIYQQIAKKLKTKNLLTPAEKNYIGYDAVQLLPIEPVAEYYTPGSSRSSFFIWDKNTTLDDGSTLKVRLKKPDTQNWGYDIVLHASSATNPSILGSLRPDELIEFIATLHMFPTRPIQVIYDLVYGHSDNQAQAILNRYFLQGANMYGQDVNHQHPIVRAILLEMQRRKINTGSDGIRVDGAQDFKFFNSSTGQVEYDDAYLQEMSNVQQEIAGYQRQLFSIFEDGRPWPAEGWEESSTYLDIIKSQPEAFQWGPLIFAHNTPSLNKFWDNRWRRVCEVMESGSHWISGCGNHDTLRRGTQLSSDADINWNLGTTLPEVIKKAYDNPAVTLLFQGFSPGIPMDFLNATMRTPWCFFRNTDDYYGLKVVAEEVGFIDWQIEPYFYDEAWAFTRIKQLGIETFEHLRSLMGWLQETLMILEDNYDLDSLVDMYQNFIKRKVDKPRQFTVNMFKAFAKAYMEDCNDLCNVIHFQSKLDPLQTEFNLSVRKYRHANPWLRQNLNEHDYFNRLSDDQKTIFYGLRTYVDDKKKELSKNVAIVSHMGGQTAQINLSSLFSVDLHLWRPVITTPELKIENRLSDLMNLKLRDGEALILETN